MSSIKENQGCAEKQFGGNCLKGTLCQECNPSTMPDLSNINFNSNAKVYVPKNKKLETESTSSSVATDTSKLNLNLNAKEFLPKFISNAASNNAQINSGNADNEDEDFENEEFDMIMNDIIDNEVCEELEGEESDDEKWLPKYKDCDCCKGYVYKCNGPACVNLGTCYCKMREECDDEEDF